MLVVAGVCCGLARLLSVLSGCHGDELLSREGQSFLNLLSDFSGTVRPALLLAALCEGCPEVRALLAWEFPGLGYS